MVETTGEIRKHRHPGKGQRRGAARPKGRQVEPAALDEVRDLLGDRPRRRDLLIEHLHLIQDRFGHLSAAHLAALAQEMRLAQAEVFEVATFYAHFDVVKEDEAPPPPLTVRVCDSLTCEMLGAKALIAALQGGLDPQAVRVVRAPCMGHCDTAPVAEVGHHYVDHATPDKVADAVRARAYPCGRPRAGRARALRRRRRLPPAPSLPRRPAHASSSWSRSSARAACAASAAPAFRPGASGSSSGRSRSPAISRSTRTRASPAPSRTATISSATRTASSKAC